MTARNDLGHLRVLTTDLVEQQPWEPIEGRPGVAHKILWQAGATVLGLIRTDPGVTDPAHTHLGAHHHLYVVAGSGTVCGQPVSEGSYAYIPPGTEHETVAGPDGITLFYTYRPLDEQHAHPDHEDDHHGGAFV